jgi:excinuclease UvrABC nuclease subunit
LLIRRFKLTDSNYKLEDLNLPDLFIIDGWKWQLWIVLQLSKEYPKMKQILEKVDFISIWKWQSRTRKWKISGAEEKIYKLEKQHIIKEINISKLPDEWYKILTKARDEAHRFANKYREKQMEIETKNLFS